MDDEAQRRVEMDRGHKASSLLDNPTFRDALEAVKDRIWGDFCSVPPSDADSLMRLRLKLEVLDDVLKDLKSQVQTGEMARIQLSEQ